MNKEFMIINLFTLFSIIAKHCFFLKKILNNNFFLPKIISGKMTGHPMPSIRWLKNEQPFEPDGSRIKSFVQEDGTFGLIFETTEGDDKGTFTAIAYR